MGTGVIAAYSGYIKDGDSLVKSASGGFARAMSEAFVDRGGVVYSVRYTDDFREAVFARASSLEELEPFRASKYIESRKVYEGFNLYDEVKKDLADGKEVLVLGLPCDIGAVKAAVKNETADVASRLFLVDLFCHGPTVRKVAEDYLDYLEKKYKSKVVDFSVRHKKSGAWTPPYLRAKFESGKVFMRTFYSTEYGMAFSILARPCCHNCKFKGDNHVSDLSIGDYWGIGPEDKVIWNRSGVSAALVRTEKGLGLIDMIRDVCVVNDADAESILKGNPLLEKQRPVHVRESDFRYLLEEKGLIEACRVINPPMKRLARKVKSAVGRMMPKSLKACLRKVLR